MSEEKNIHDQNPSYTFKEANVSYTFVFCLFLPKVGFRVNAYGPLH